MSADNGIYILKSPADNLDMHEYRVAHRQAIDNITFQPDREDGFNSNELLNYFGDCPVYLESKLAFERAIKIEEEIKNSDFPILEYGISTITLKYPFPEIKSKTIFYKNNIKKLYDEHDTLINIMDNTVNRLKEISEEIEHIKKESGLSLSQLLSEE